MRQEIIWGDCLKEMPKILNASVDMVLCDLPYGTTACKWDVIIAFDLLWKQYNRLVKPHGAIVLFGNEPFTSLLVHSNLKGFKYRWDWNKKIPSGMSYAKYRPMQQTEDICIFTKNGEKSFYNPQMIIRDKPIKGGGMVESESAASKGYIALKKTYPLKNPVTLIQFAKIRKGSLHPTQKPVSLFEYLIKTYTNEGDLVLDNCAGSGTTGVACKNLNRQFILIEKEWEYYQIAKQRVFGIPPIPKSA